MSTLTGRRSVFLREHDRSTCKEHRVVGDIEQPEHLPGRGQPALVGSSYPPVSLNSPSSSRPTNTIFGPAKTLRRNESRSRTLFFASSRV